MCKLNIIIPCYQNQNNVPDLFHSLSCALNKLPNYIQYTLIFVDDGSTDNTKKLLDKYCSIYSDITTKIIQHKKNLGSFVAIKTGILFDNADLYVNIAADLQDPPIIIINAIKEWENTHASIIYLIRNKRDENQQKLLFATLYYTIMSVFSLNRFPIMGCDSALIDHSIKKIIQKQPYSASIHLYLYLKGLSIKAERNIYFQKARRKQGKSQWNLQKKINLMIFSMTFFGSPFIHFILFSSTLYILFGPKNISMNSIILISTFISLLPKGILLYLNYNESKKIGSSI